MWIGAFIKWKTGRRAFMNPSVKGIVVWLDFRGEFGRLGEPVSGLPQPWGERNSGF